MVKNEILINDSEDVLWLVLKRRHRPKEIVSWMLVAALFKPDFKAIFTFRCLTMSI